MEDKKWSTKNGGQKMEIDIFHLKYVSFFYSTVEYIVKLRY